MSTNLLQVGTNHPYPFNTKIDKGGDSLSELEATKLSDFENMHSHTVTVIKT